MTEMTETMLARRGADVIPGPPGESMLVEARDYRQIIALVNRHDWLSSFCNELGVVLAVERMMELEVPERAQWIRVLMAEWNRVLNHLMFVGSFGLELGAITPVFFAFREREDIQHLMESATGGRLHFTYNRVGGLNPDVALSYGVSGPTLHATGIAEDARVTEPYCRYDAVDVHVPTGTRG